MKFHYVYFLLLPVLLILALMTPLYPEGYFDGKSRNAFADGITAYVVLAPTLLATVLLLIRNRITAIIGTCFYLLTSGLAGYIMIFSIERSLRRSSPYGIGSYLIFVVTISALILSIIHTVKLFKKRKQKSPLDISDIIDSI